MTPDWEGDPPIFESARQLSLPDLLDPFAWKFDEVEVRAEWEFTPKQVSWWGRYPNLFSQVLNKDRREKLVISPKIIEPTLLLRTCYEEIEWAALSGYFQWKEPVPIYMSNKWGTPHALHLWMFNSYAVPESALRQFTGRMIEPVLRSDMCPKPPDFQSEILTLLKYPGGTDELERYCGHTFARTPGAWFTTCNYEDEQHGSRSLKGHIPSPPLAKLLKVKWTKSGLDFSVLKASQPMICDVRHEGQNACMCQAKPLLAAFEKHNLRLVWRVFGWKWISGGHNQNSPQREYWALYCLNTDGEPICLGGGTWLAKPDPVCEPLPWPVGHLPKKNNNT